MIDTKLRDFLIDHLNGPVDANGKNFKVRRIALERKLIKMERWYHQWMPRRTEITTAGREELAKALADWAEALSAAQEKGMLK